MLRRVVLAGLFAPALSLAWIPGSFATVASVTLDWSQLQIEVLPIAGYPSPGLTFFERTGSLATSANTFGDSSDSHTRTTSNWTNSAHAESITPGARANASASNQTLHAGASSIPPADQNLPFFIPNTASAQAGRSATLRLDGPAALVFSMPYHLEMNGGPLFDFDNYVTAAVSGGASFQPDVGSSWQNVSREFSFDSRFGPQMVGLSGPLIFGLVVDGAGLVSVGWNVSAASFSRDFTTPVPEPAALLQMLAGLIAIGGVAARRGLTRWSA